MLLNKLFKFGIVYIFITLSTIFFHNHSAECGEMDQVRVQFQDLVDRMDDTVGWKQYVQDISKSPYKILLKAISALQTDYYNSISKLEQCVGEIDNLEKQYSKKWLDDLIEKFGMDFVQANEDDILLCLAAISVNSTTSHCQGDVEKLLTQEAILYQGYRLYLSYFEKYYDTLDKSKQTMLRPQKDAADSFHSLINAANMSSVIFGGILGKRSEIKAKEKNPGIYDFLSKHPDINKIDTMKAREDLFKITRGK